MTEFDDTKTAFVISRYTTENSNYKRHIIDVAGKEWALSKL